MEFHLFLTTSFHDPKWLKHCTNSLKFSTFWAIFLTSDWFFSPVWCSSASVLLSCTDFFFCSFRFDFIKRRESYKKGFLKDKKQISALYELVYVLITLHITERAFTSNWKINSTPDLKVQLEIFQQIEENTSFYIIIDIIQCWKLVAEYEI